MKPLTFICCLLLAPLTASAHAVDQYSQRAQLTLEPACVRVALHMTPGTQVAGRVLAVVDTNGDDALSAEEGAAYAQRVLRDVVLELDGNALSMALVGIELPTREQLIAGVGVIRLELVARADVTVGGDHQLRFRNDHLPGSSAYLANVLVPDDAAIHVRGQDRDGLQHELRVRFRVERPQLRSLGLFLLGLCLGLALLLPRRMRLIG